MSFHKLIFSQNRPILLISLIKVTKIFTVRIKSQKCLLAVKRFKNYCNSVLPLDLSVNVIYISIKIEHTKNSI